jgi:DNA-binding PadR family transcriptional regulator
MNILEFILKELGAHGNVIHGTFQLYDCVPASHNNIRLALRKGNDKGLIRSIHSHGGRGRRSIHKLTAKGLRYVAGS